MPNNSVMTSVYAFPYTLWELGVKSLSRVGKGVSDMTLRFVYGAKLTIFGTTNGVARIKIYIGDKDLLFALVTLFGRTSGAT